MNSSGDVDADAISPFRPRLERQRKLSQIVDCRLERVVGREQLGVIVHFADARFLHKMIAKAAHVAHQIANQNWPDWRDQFSVGFQDLHGAEGRNVFRQRFDQPEAPLFEQRHKCGADNRLRHRIEAEDGVGGHGLARLFVAPAERSRVHDLASARDERVDPGVDAAVDVGLHRGPDALQATGVHSDRIRRFDCVVHWRFLMAEWDGSIMLRTGGVRHPADLELPGPRRGGTCFGRRNDEGAKPLMRA